MDLAQYKADTYSQFGEDGIIAECLKRIEGQVPLTRWCVEFGAWDGVHLSNTCRLIREESFSAVMIEGDAQRFEELKLNLPEARVLGVLEWIALDGPKRLDSVLARTPIPEDFDVLSIDIDGCDWHVWKSLKDFRPRLVCIEFNPTVTNDFAYVQPADFGVKRGCGPRALVELAEEKGYVLAAATNVNLIFVLAEFADAVLGTDRPALDELRDESKSATHVFVGYDGEIVMSAPLRLAWHRFEIRQEDIQVLPKSLRTYSDDYSNWQQIYYHVVRFWWKLRHWRF